MAYLIYLGTLAAIYVIVTLAYALPVGYAGMLNLGHVGLFAVGAYVSALLTTHGISLSLALPGAAALAGVMGFFLALPASRIKGDYYALMTLGFTFVVNAVLLNWIPLTRGPFGISGIPRPEGIESPTSYFILVLAVTTLVAFLVYRIVRSPFGMALQAVRDDDLVAESLGKPTAKLRIASLTISALIVGVAGALLAHLLQFINPQTFWLDAAVLMLAMVVVGGLASFQGAILGAILLVTATEAVRFLPLGIQHAGALRLAAFSLALLAVVLFRPKGIMGRAQIE